jgi:hypothetical protein
MCAMGLLITLVLFSKCKEIQYTSRTYDMTNCINETCNPMNGTCPDGECQPGYKDDTCSTGMWYGDWL